MPTTEARTSITSPLARVVPTGADTASPATIDVSRADRLSAWQKVIDEKLLPWLEDPSQVADEGVKPPTATILRLAIDYAEKFRDDGFAPPDSVILDPNGGVVFERRRDNVAEVFHFWDDGTLEYQRFRGANLIERQAR